MALFTQGRRLRIIKAALLDGDSNGANGVEDCRARRRDFDVLVASEEKDAQRDEDGAIVV